MCIPQPAMLQGVYALVPSTQEAIMRGALLWLVGIPIPVIIALYLFGVL